MYLRQNKILTVYNSNLKTMFFLLKKPAKVGMVCLIPAFSIAVRLYSVKSM